MTKAKYIVEHGAEWRKFAKKEACDALLRMIDDEGPARQLTKLAETDKLAGSAVFLNKISGWEELRALLAGLADVPETPADPEDKFEKPEI